MKNEQLGLYGSLGKIENAKDEWWNEGANLSLVGCILGCQRFTRKSLRLYKLPTIQTTPYAGAGSQCLPCKSLRCSGSRRFKSFLMPVLASNNSHANPEACSDSQQLKQFLMLGQASNKSHVTPYACAGSNNAKNSLCLCRLPKIHMEILMLVQVPDNSNNSLRRGRLPTIHTQILTLVQVPTMLRMLRLCSLPTIHTRILMLVQVPNNSNNSLHWGRLPTIHTQILMLVQVLTMLKIPYACAGFQQFTHESLRL
ncbi:hypothetical protein O181_108399 [Austropuccinia psidii MF-1]|uniref:Uncharacterized protein n=1 Tax=Austropuccinia psidii MF-1 TaxID=1389203 RepID=A0A9Q3PNX2_9BASI|nr:hypothetical protein [Austropuccinia psidii MF-1]